MKNIYYSSLIFLVTTFPSLALNHSATMTVRVTDEAGVIVTGASVLVSFEIDNIGGKTTVREGLTDTNGMYTATEITSGYIFVRIVKTGFYKSEHRFKWHQQQNDAGAFSMSGKTNDIILRIKSNPIPMFARSIRKKLPVNDLFIGFDLIKADWVQPYGTGMHSDIEILANRSYKDLNNFSASLRVRFKDSDGILLIAENLFADSEFQSPRLAPDNAYHNGIDLYMVRENGRLLDGLYNKPNNYFFRVRTKRNNNGDVESALYGKIIGGINYGGVQSDSATVWFTYYLNPSPNDRSLEFDPHRNLFLNLPDAEKVRLP